MTTHSTSSKDFFTLGVEWLNTWLPLWQSGCQQAYQAGLEQVKQQLDHFFKTPAPWQALLTPDHWQSWGQQLGQQVGLNAFQEALKPWVSWMQSQGMAVDTNQFLPLSLFPNFNDAQANVLGIQSIASDVLIKLQQEYLQELFRLSHAFMQADKTAIGEEWAIQDRRFSGKAWQDKGANQYNALLYLLNAKYMMSLADSVQTDSKTKQRIQFAVQQWLDAVSPSNFLATNPEAQRELIETKGESLRQGIENLLTDLAKGRISQSDESAFVVGKNVATTEGAVVYQNDLMQIIHYKPLVEEVGARPLLIVPPCINKFYILDLQPDNSLVKYALEQGNQVFLISWRNAQQTQNHLTWDDYVANGVISAIDVVKSIGAADQINTLGFCIGGTLLACALNVLQAKGLKPVASMTLLTTMLDFSDAGILNVYVDEAQVRLREQAIGKQGLMPGRDLASAFSSLRANDLVWHYVVNNYLKGQHPPAFDLLYWNGDSTNLPGPMYCWYLRNTYLENKLCQANAVKVCGEGIDFSKLDIPVYALAAREDHIVPWQSAYLSNQLLSLGNQNNRFVLTASGHIAGVINPASKNKRNFWINEVLPQTVDADTWFSSAQHQPGSWWQDWSKWLKQYQGQAVSAPNMLGSESFPILETAPGSYVAQKA